MVPELAGDMTLRRDAVFDWALPFLGAALFVFRDFMERVDIVWAPLVRGAGIDARTTQSPAHREANPKCFTGWPCPPAGTQPCVLCGGSPVEFGRREKYSIA